MNKLINKYKPLVDGVKNLVELNTLYKKETENILKGILIKTGWDQLSVSPYSSISFIAVPGILEFAGIYAQINRLIDLNLPVYFSPKLMHLFDKKYVPSSFKNLNKNKILSLFKKSDPRILGLAAENFKYHHQGRIYLKKNFRVNGSPDGFSGSEYNGMLALSNCSVCYENNPFSERLTLDIFNWFDTKEVESRQNLELRAFKELSYRVLEEFNLGNRLEEPRTLKK